MGICMSGSKEEDDLDQENNVFFAAENAKLREQLKTANAQLYTLHRTINEQNATINKANATINKANATIVAKTSEAKSEVKKRLISDEKRLISDGIYYTRLNKLWTLSDVEFEGAEEVIRKVRNSHTGTFQGYNGIPVPAKDRAKNYKKIFPVGKLFPGKPTNKTNDFSLAHLVPQDRTCSGHWGLALSVILGHSCNCGDDCNWITCDTLRHLIEGRQTDQTLEAGIKKPDSAAGIKQLPLNFLKLPDKHAKFFDHIDQHGFGCIIVPIWASDDAWQRGVPYSALVVGREPEDYRWLGNTFEKEEEDDKIRRRSPWIKSATAEDLQKGTKFICDITKMLADQLTGQRFKNFYEFAKENPLKVKDLLPPPSGASGSVASVSRQSSNDVDAQTSDTRTNTKSASNEQSRNGKPPMQNPQRKKPPLEVFNLKLEALHDVRTTLESESKVVVPMLNMDYEDAKVLKVDLEEYFQSDQKYHDTWGFQWIPDPYLVGLKAAVNWSAMLGGSKLLPACNESESPPSGMIVTAPGENGSTCSSLSLPSCGLPFPGIPTEFVETEESFPLTGAVVTPDKTVKD